ncbi:MAG: Uma2 family endonuclease [Planctomycetia bacterium]|nr:Uma2 family endonuclease [Planctomycetia bacterium]
MIRSNSATTGSITVDEFFEQVEDGQKADLIDGVIWMASPDSLDADDVQGFIRSLVHTYIAAKGIGGRVCGSRVAFVLNESNAPEPDLAYLTPERYAAQHGKRVKGPPDIAVEVTCEDSRSRDYEAKFRLYEQFGVQEYWIVDLENSRAEFFVLKHGRFEPLPLEDGRIYRSTVIPGFWLDARWLTESPLPNVYACQKLILGQ